MENVKEYLDNIRHYVGLENAYNEQLLQVRLIGYTAPISNYSNIGGSNGTRGDSIQERYMLALEKLEDEIKDKAVGYTKAITKFYEELERVPNSLYRLVLLLYYGSKKSLQDVATEIDKSLDRTKHIKQEAIMEFAKCI